MAEVKQVSTGSKLESIGTVKTVVGEVKAVDAAGNERILQAGDKVFANETIVTAAGGLVMIEFADGTYLDLPSAAQIVLDTDVFNPANAAASEGKELTAEQIQEMIARGEDPTAVTEATAAGIGSGDEGGSSFIQVGFNNAKGNVDSGYQTQGIPGPESTTFTELPPVEDDVVTLLALVDELPLVNVPDGSGPIVNVPTNDKNGNNGWGNGDQTAPGNSGSHNGAENDINNSNNNSNNSSSNNDNNDDNDDNDNDNDNSNNDNSNNDNSNNDNSNNDNSNNDNSNNDNSNNDNSNNDNSNNDNSNNDNSNNDNSNNDNSNNDNSNNDNSNNDNSNNDNSNNDNSNNTHPNNGYGNDDQDAPGGSLDHNSAENDQHNQHEQTASGQERTGDNKSNELTGGAGDDILIGGGSDDKLTGGAGADQFVWKNNDTVQTVKGDTITDFKVSEGDTLNFEDLLSNAGGTLGLVSDGGNTTVTLDTGKGIVNLVTLTGVTGETLDTLLG